jgi:hypothetical protein
MIVPSNDRLIPEPTRGFALVSNGGQNEMQLPVHALIAVLSFSNR